MRRIIFLSLILIIVIVLMVYLRGVNSQDADKTSLGSGEFAFDDDSDFTKLGKPKPGDWLDRFPEHGQTFEQYVRSKPLQPDPAKAGSAPAFGGDLEASQSRSIGRGISVPLQPDKTRNKIVIQPIGPFNDQEKALLGKLKEYTSIFFQMPVVLASGIPLPKTKKYKRQRQWGSKTWTQYHAGYLLERVLKPRLPDDAFCYLGITMVDLYPKDSWNYVFGLASFRDRVGVYSLVRYFPDFWNEPDTKKNRIQTLRRSCSTLAHETCHMFGMHHCIFYECLVCGSNSLEESDRRPLRLCPICLRKVHWNLGLNVIKRYEDLEKFYRTNDLISEADWTKNRLAKIKKAK